MGPINVNLLWMIGGTFAALAMGTAIRLVALRNSDSEIVKQRIGSLKVWWLLAVLWSLAVLFGQPGVALLLAVASFLAMREYLRLLGPIGKMGWVSIAGLGVLGVVHYSLIVSGASAAAKWFFPIAGLIWLGASRAASCEAKDYVRVSGGLYFGAMLMIYALSHSLFLFDVSVDIVQIAGPDEVSYSRVEPLVGMAGWFLFLVLLTEMNDIMQAIVGRQFGKTKITPEVSPNKSVEGLVGGIVSTAILSVLLAPMLTTLTFDRSPVSSILICIGAGVVISIFGFLGDINMSAIKRDAGVKDGSSLFPGMGGMIDRIDSMTFTGPAFYYFVLLTNPQSMSH